MSAALTIDDPSYFDRLADVESRHWWSSGMWRIVSYWLDEALAGRRNVRALDVGCGTGMTARRLVGRPEISEVIGVDPSTAALSHARRRHDRRLVRGSALALPFDDRRFDVITCFDVVQHLPPGGHLRAAREISRVLAPGGVAIVRSNGRGWSGGASAYLLCDLVNLVASSGLRIERASYANSVPAMIQEMRGRLLRLTASPHPSGGGLRIRVPSTAANRVLGGVAGIEAWLAGRIGLRLPFGHSTLVCAKKPG